MRTDFDVTEFGAAGSGDRLETEPIQTAVDACYQAGGGRVVVPQRVYVLGTIFLRSNVELHLQTGARLLASTNPDDYDSSRNLAFDGASDDTLCPHAAGHMILARDVENVPITGHGTIDGNGGEFFEGTTSDALHGDEADNLRGSFIWHKPKSTRPNKLVAFVGCENVVLRDFRLVDSPFWSLWLHDCRNVNVEGVTITAEPGTINSDGVDIDSWRNVRVSNCSISTGDDCIAIFATGTGGTRNEACEDIAVTNCVLDSTSCGVRMGFRGDGAVHNMTFSNIVMRQVRHGIDITVSGRPLGERRCAHGPTVEDILFDNIAMHAQTPFYLWTGEGARPPGALRDITFSNITATSRTHCYIGDQKELPVERIRFDNVSLRYSGEMDDEFLSVLPSDEDYRWFAYDLYAGLPCAVFMRHVRDIDCHNVRIDWGPVSGTWRNAIWAENVQGPDLDGLVTRQPIEGSDHAAVRVVDGKEEVVRNCRALKGTATFLRIDEGKGPPARVLNSDFAKAARGWDVGDGRQVHGTVIAEGNA